MKDVAEVRKGLILELESLEQQKVQFQANLYACDGAMSMVKHLIEKIDNPEQKPEDPKKGLKMEK